MKWAQRRSCVSFEDGGISFGDLKTFVNLVPSKLVGIHKISLCASTLLKCVGVTSRRVVAVSQQFNLSSLHTSQQGVGKERVATRLAERW